jgi:hypothetical protein
MVAEAGMKVIILILPYTLGLAVCEFSHSDWSLNELDGVNLILAFMS